jgi:hypothetical protein
MMMLMREIRWLVFVCLTVLLVVTTTKAQQRILWQGAVMQERINVYVGASTSERVSTTLKKGELVDVVLEINTLGDAWCRVAFSGQSEPLGYVLCLHLEQGHFKPTQPARSEPVATLSSAQVPAITTKQKLTEATAVSPAALTNKDILDMSKIGLPTEVLVAKIKSSQSNFDTSPSQLKQLKAAGLADPVILAMVQAPVGRPEPASASADPPPAAENAKPIPATVTVPSAPRQQGEQADSRPCVILKRMGPADEITSHLYSFGIRGKQFQSVEGTLPKGVSFHGRLTDHDVRTIENKGGKVVVIEPKYTTQDLDHARQECREQ